MSEEIIKVLDALCEKLDIAVDWTSVNVIPYLEQLCAKFVKYEIATSIVWMVIATLIAIVFVAFAKVFEWDADVCVPMIFAIIVAIVVICFQTFDIIECCIFPEKAIYEYITLNMNNS